MIFLKELFIGYKNYLKGIIFLFKHNLYWYFIFPLILFAAIYLLGTYFKELEISMNLDLEKTSEKITTINGLIWSILKIMFFDTLYIIFTQFTLYIVVVVLSPVLAMLSEKIEQIITSKKYNYSFKMLLNDIKRGAIIAFRNLIWYYILVGIFLGVLSLFDLPEGSDFFVFSIPFIVGFYYYGFSFMDYVNERKRLNIQQSIYYVSNHKGLAISIGSVYSICFLLYFYVTKNFSQFSIDTTTQVYWTGIVIVLLILAAISPILAITSATLSINEIDRKK